MKDLIDENSSETVYLEVPKVNLDTVIASNADVHDIIQYSVGTGQWNIVFDASANGSTVQFVTNTTTLDRLKYNGTTWVNAFEGTYNPGFWRVYL